jgi:hypothetical protein
LIEKSGGRVEKLLRRELLCDVTESRYSFDMTLDTLIKEVESLADTEGRKLLAFMVALEDRGRGDYQEMLARKIDDVSPGRWLTPEQCERELGLADEAR